MNIHSFIFAAQMRIRDEHKEIIVKETALDMLVELGFDGFSMQKLAKKAGVSPATLYIYYKDKEDLIVQLGIEEGQKMTRSTMEGFSPEMSFEDGLRLQWKNRANYWLQNSVSSKFYEQIKHSPYYEKVMAVYKDEFKVKMTAFAKKAVLNGELKRLPFEVYWSLAFAPLYNLINFQMQGQSIGGLPFTWSEEIMNQTLELVLKALKP